MSGVAVHACMECGAPFVTATARTKQKYCERHNSHGFGKPRGSVTRQRAERAERFQKAQRAAGPMRLEIPRELKSPNCWNGRHWRYKHRESQDWEKSVWVAIAKRTGARDVLQVLSCMNAIPALKRTPQEKRRVIVTRLSPSARNFIRDDDNLRFAVKPLLDALKRLGLIYDDSRKWIDLPTPTQAVSTDGGWRTVIEIEPVEDVLQAIGVRG